MKENTIKAVLAAALGALASYGTQLIVPAIILVAVKGLGYIKGLTQGRQGGGARSRVRPGGLPKKVGDVGIAAGGCLLGWVGAGVAGRTGGGWRGGVVIASIVVIWLVINELISILENVAALGAPVPGFLQSLIKRLKVSVEDKVEPKEET